MLVHISPSISDPSHSQLRTCSSSPIDAMLPHMTHDTVVPLCLPLVSGPSRSHFGSGNSSYQQLAPGLATLEQWERAVMLKALGKVKRGAQAVKLNAAIAKLQSETALDNVVSFLSLHPDMTQTCLDALKSGILNPALGRGGG